MLHYRILFCRSDQPLACPILCLALPNAFTTLTHIPGPSQSKPVLLQSVLSLLVSGSQHILQWFSSPVSSIHLLSYLLGCAGSHLDKPEGKKRWHQFCIYHPFTSPISLVVLTQKKPKASTAPGSGDPLAMQQAELAWSQLPAGSIASLNCSKGLLSMHWRRLGPSSAGPVDLSRI